MDTQLDARSIKPARQKHAPSALGRWSRDARSPALRLSPPAQDLDITAPLPVLPVPPPAPREHAQAVFESHAKPVIQLRPITPRQTMPFVGRETACPYLECRASNRRCLSAQPAPISLERQVRYCFGPDHRQCRYYRKARGLPSVPPTQAAFYTAAAVTVLILIVLAGVW